MKRILKSINWHLLLAVVLIPILIPAIVQAATFICYVTLKDESNITYNYTPVIMQQDNNWLSTHGYATSSMLDVRIADASGVVLPAMYADDKTLFVPSSIPANSISQYVWSSGNTALASHDIVVGDGGYVTTPDNADLELADSFALEISGYFTTSEASNITYKQDAFKLSKDNSGNITATFGPDAGPTKTLTVSGVTSGERVVKVGMGGLDDDSVNVGGITQVLTKGAEGQWDDDLVGDPNVFSYNSTYYMFYTARSNGLNLSIGYATSNNLVTWTKYASNPILTYNEQPGVDNVHATDPYVIKVGSTFYMYYHGYDGVSDKLAVATASEAEFPNTWHKYASNPILTGTGGQWDAAGVHMGSVIYEDGIFKMLYVGGATSVSNTGYATSTDGLHWTKYASNPVMSVSVGQWDSVVAAVGYVVKIGSTYYMVYEGNQYLEGNPLCKYELGFASSPDLIHWTKSAANPILSPQVATWYAYWVEAPEFLIADDGSYRLLFIGCPDSNRVWSIGLTNLNLESTFTLSVSDSSGNLIGSDSESNTGGVPDNGNDWVWYADPYLDYIKLETSN